MKKSLATICISLCLFQCLPSYGEDARQNAKVYNLVNGLPNIYLLPMSEQIGVTWSYGNVWDKSVIEKFYSLIAAKNDHCTVLDVGAQTGSFTLLAKFLPHSEWHAFEPIQEAAETLSGNLSINDIYNVTVVQKAASNVPGVATLKLPPLNDLGLATLGSNVLRFTPVQEREVACIDLDGYVDALAIQKVDFIKIDTEGWELNVLKGGEKMLRRDRPVILMEFNVTNMQQCNVTPREIETYLDSLGYDWKSISSDDILCMPRTE